MYDLFSRFSQLSDPQVSGIPFNIVVDEEKCVGCGLCVKQCPTQTLKLDKKDADGRRKPSFVAMGDYFPQLCIACHNCEVVCPHEALEIPHYYQVDQGYWKTHFDYPDVRHNGYPNPFMAEEAPEFSTIEDKLTETEKVILKRRSVRMYKKKPVPKEMIHRMLEAGRFTPSAGNNQPWQFIVIRDPQLLAEIGAATLAWTTKMTKLYQGKNFWRQALKKSLAILRPRAIDQRPMLAMQALLTPNSKNEPLDVFFGAKTCILVLQNSLGISNPSFDAGLCCQNMVLAAHSLGLGTCYVGFVSGAMNMDRSLRVVKKRLGIKWPYSCVATAITVGYPAAQTDGATRREFPKVKWLE